MHKLFTLARRTIVGITLAGLAVTTVAATAAAKPATDPAIVRTDNGLVRGTVADDHRSFQGIPYAAPPEGELRWRSPQPATRWTGVRDATRPGSACPQNPGFVTGDHGSLDEDCLYVNVTTPRYPAARPRPVLVFIHGNGFINGAGSIYGGRPLAVGGDVVVVTVNYRLGVFGFLTHPALPGSGNFGIEDQQAALRWVKRNAAAFGGDPRNVTVFGESAGGVSTCAQLLSPGSAGLFHRAIVQSGACTMHRTYFNDWGFHTRDTAERRGLALAEQHRCTQPAAAAACLRELSVEKLLDMPDLGFGFGPVHGDNPVLPLSPAQALESGRFNRVPVMQGTTRDEHRTFTAGLELIFQHVLEPHEYPQEIARNFGPDSERVLAEYPLGEQNPSIALSAVVTDSSWGCQAFATDRLLARHVPVYAYEFADGHAPWFAMPSPRKLGDGSPVASQARRQGSVRWFARKLAHAPLPSFPTGAFHAGELQYLFDGAYSDGVLSPEQRQLAERMVRYWARFAHAGDPNGRDLPAWPRFRHHGERVMSLDTGAEGIRPVDFDREHRCGFWATIGQGSTSPAE